MPAYTDYNCTLTAYGMDTYGLSTTWPLRVVQVAYGLNIIGTEDEAASVKTFYARQVQEDVFSLAAQFVNAKERRDFFSWYQAYAQYATSSGPVGAVRVQVPAREFDFLGTLTTGMGETTTPQDVVWTVTLQFNGAQPTVALSSAYLSDAMVNGKPLYQAPSNDPTVAQWFYPESPLSVTVPSSDLAGQTPYGSTQSAHNAVQSVLNLGLKAF